MLRVFYFNTSRQLNRILLISHKVFLLEIKKILACSHNIFCYKRHICMTLDISYFVVIQKTLALGT